MRVLEGLEPKRVLYYFEDLCRIPHGSGNTKAISDYCVRFAVSHGLAYKQDEWNNVLITKPAARGYEDHPTVILQGHLDMVCEQDPDCPLNMETDGLQLATDGEYIFARGTTLGGDDGIAVAMALAILEDETLAHPPLEVLFTTDEETGMYGAAGVDPAWLSGRLLINADSENEGVLTVGCAGGARAALTLPVTCAPANGGCYTVTVSGLLGGHSGVEIHKGRLNANAVMGAFLHRLTADYRIVSLGGGSKDNAIPRTCECVIQTAEDPTALAAAFVTTAALPTDPDLTITVAPAPAATAALTAADSRRVAEFLVAVPNGIQAMSADIEGLVQTSLNLGILTLTDEELTATFAVRSSVNDEKRSLLAALVDCAARFGGKADIHGEYPAWEYRQNSPLRDTMCQVYRRLYGADPVVEVIHAGLECGLLSDKLPGLDAVSFGPDMEDIHTSRERLSVASTARTYTYLCETLKSL